MKKPHRIAGKRTYRKQYWTAQAIADAFAADADVSSYVVTGQDAEIASVQHIIDGKQSMTVLKDVRTLVSGGIAAAVAYLEGGAPEETSAYDNGGIDVPAKPSAVIAVDQENVQAAIIDSGYWDASEFTGLEAMGEAPTAEISGLVGIVLPTREEPRWIQDEACFRDALEAAGYEVEILFSQGDSAIEKTNVEQLITQGIEVLIICPHDGSAAGEGQHRVGLFHLRQPLFRKRHLAGEKAVVSPRPRSVYTYY